MSGDRRVTGKTVSIRADFPITGPTDLRLLPSYAIAPGGRVEPTAWGVNFPLTNIAAGVTLTPFPGIIFTAAQPLRNASINWDQPNSPVTFTPTPAAGVNFSVTTRHAMITLSIQKNTCAIGAGVLGAAVGYLMPLAIWRVTWTVDGAPQPMFETADRIFTQAAASPGLTTGSVGNFLFMLPGTPTLATRVVNFTISLQNASDKALDAFCTCRLIVD